MSAVHRPVVIEPETWVGAFGEVDDAAAPLTEDQVAELEEGTPVTIIWSGGNGPHDYTITVGEDGQRYAMLDRAGRVTRFTNPLRFVGQRRYHTRVWLWR